MSCFSIVCFSLSSVLIEYGVGGESYKLFTECTDLTMGLTKLYQNSGVLRNEIEEVTSERPLSKKKSKEFSEKRENLFERLTILFEQWKKEQKDVDALSKKRMFLNILDKLSFGDKEGQCDYGINFPSNINDIKKSINDTFNSKK